jgi:hypothetical protein
MTDGRRTGQIECVYNTFALFADWRQQHSTRVVQQVLPFHVHRLRYGHRSICESTSQNCMSIIAIFQWLPNKNDTFDTNLCDRKTAWTNNAESWGVKNFRIEVAS